MRKIVGFVLAFFIPIWTMAQCTGTPTVPTGQIFNISSEQQPGGIGGIGNVFSHTDEDVALWWAITDTQVNGASVDPYFSISRTNEGGALFQLRGFSDLFTRTPVDIVMTIIAGNNCGTAAPVNVTVRVADAILTTVNPVLPGGQIFQTNSTSTLNSPVGLVYVYNAADPMGTPPEYSMWIAGQTPDLGLFSMFGETNEIQINNDLGLAPYPSPTDNPQRVTLDMEGIMEGRPFGPVPVTVEISMQMPPVVQPGQVRNVSALTLPFSSIQPPLALAGSFRDPQNSVVISILSVSEPWAEGAFFINGDNNFVATTYLDSLDYPNNDRVQTVTMEVQPMNEYGVGEVETVTVNIIIPETSRCPRIFPDQTGFTSYRADVGEVITESIASQKVSFWWIDRTYLDGNLIPGTLFEISQVNGALTVARPLDDPALGIDPNTVTRFDIVIAGSNPDGDDGCSSFTSTQYSVYVLPGDHVTPQVAPGQVRWINSDLAVGSTVGEPVVGSVPTTNPTSPILGYSIGPTGGVADGLFRITDAGQIFILNSLADVPFTDGLATLELPISAVNDNGAGDAEIVTINIVEVTAAGPEDPETPTTPVGTINSITFISNASPMEVTSVGHGLTSGALVSISNVAGPATANGVWNIEVIDANTFALQDSLAGGVWDAVGGADAQWILLANGAGTEQNYANLIVDDELRTCIQETVGTANVTESLASGLTHLDCSCRVEGGIANLIGLRFFRNIQFLALQNNVITDITPITGLTRLVDLKLSGNLITDITTFNPFASLTSLERLDLSNNQIRNVGAFNTATSLQWLSLANNNICDITGLVALTETGSLGVGDDVILDGNHLLSQGAQQQVAELETAGVIVSLLDNDSTCPPVVRLVTFDQWPLNNDVRDYTGAISDRPDCNN